ncbi:MAG TPA: Na/Pi symporter [Bacillota bacterium]|nr:Na/Pi cotransporter family protein [Bacillota bacterium]HOA34957.1 Na/Pi symporter [Bacillota bacterium]HOJ83203.1 Na/Pi symporter [Bacillota bacterium]HOL14703.1 Na/Pi symporter [Bacillota bacterium]HPZ11114.1 Na/Pi symporter [Bacillota bacterium]
MSWPGLLKAAVFLAVFLFGLRRMSGAIARSSGTAFPKILAGLTGTPWRSFGTGFLVTALLQSSSLTTVMVVSLVNAGVMTFSQGCGVIIGANVGTTITGQLLSFNLHWLAWPLLGLALLCRLIPHPGLRKASGPLCGCGLLLLGMSGMTAALASLKEGALFNRVLQAAGETLWRGLLTGVIGAALLQSSSAVVGIVLSLAHEEMIRLPAALMLVIGADLGTCTTALIAAAGMERTARRAAWFHFFFNLISLALAAAFYPYLLLIAEKSAAALPRQLANAHFLYNLLGAIVLLPLAAPLSRRVERCNFWGAGRR